MKREKMIRPERAATFAGSLITFILCVVTIMGGIVGFGLDAQTALIGAIIVMMVFGVCFLHIKFQDLVQAMVRSLNDSLECILILLVIGMLIALWMACGTVPYIIYLGLGMLNPAWYLPFIVIMCAVLSSITGSSWTTIGTIGVAFIGISMGMGLPVPVTAGAIVCGAYFGDKCSPVSDIVVFNSGITKQNVYKHAKNVLWTTVPALIVSLIIFTILGISVTSTIAFFAGVEVGPRTGGMCGNNSRCTAIQPRCWLYRDGRDARLFYRRHSFVGCHAGNMAQVINAEKLLTVKFVGQS